MHNNPTPPTGDTNSQADLPLDKTVPTATTLYNYDQDKDSEVGLNVNKGGSGASESDLTKYENWQTGALSEDLIIDGVTNLQFWSAMKDFQSGNRGIVQVFLRDYNGSSYTEITNATLDVSDWQGGSSTWVQKTLAFSFVDYYIVPAGNQLEIKIIVDPDAANNMWFAYDTTAYDSQLELASLRNLRWLHNNPTPPTGDTNSQADLSLDITAPTATTLYNYDQDRDAFAGRFVIKGGSGASESDLSKYENWQTGALSEDLIIDGVANLTFWSAMKNFTTGTRGSVQVFLRDYNGSSYTEITNGTLDVSDWQGGSSTWVQKNLAFPSVSYTVPAGNQLEVKIIVDPNAGDNMWFAYDTTAYDSKVALP